MAMTERQILFCEAYLANGFNARNAYHSTFGNTDNNQPSYPYTLLKKPEIQEYIETRRKEIYDSLNIDAVRIAERLALIGFAEKEDERYTVANQLKALELLQKQFGLQNQKLDVKHQETIEVSLEFEDEDKGE